MGSDKAQPKTVLITGTSKGGIGDALAREFHARGLRVLATARNLAKVAHLRALGIETLALDVEDAASVREAVAAVADLTNGRGLDILVNNAGMGYQAAMVDTDTDAARRMFNVNVFGLVEVTRQFAPLVVQARGRVVNIGSVAARMPLPWQGMYNASKAAVQSISENMRLELAPLGVTVIHVR